MSATPLGEEGGRPVAVTVGANSPGITAPVLADEGTRLTRPVRFDALPPDEQIKRLRLAISTMAWWLVSAHTGFGERDARGIEDVIENGDGNV